MNGITIGTLNIYKKTGATRGSPLWTMSGNQGLQWQKAQVSVSSSVGFQVTFEGIIGPGYKSDIALDDIDISLGACPTAGSCNFEKDLCDWTNANAGDDFDWERIQGATASNNTGPQTDHTLNSAYGTYLYIEASDPRQQGDKAWLVSSAYPNGTDQCISWWYNMNGGGMGTLNVNVWPYNTGMSQTTIWLKSGDQGPMWNQGQVQILDPGAAYRIVFEAIRGPNYNSDLAIDDIILLPGNCMGHAIPQLNPCVYQCDGHCVRSDQICNLINDCSDIRDENTCGYNCNFETGTCNWSNTNGTSFVFKQGPSPVPNSNLGPLFDHTTLSPNGHYMYLDADKGSLYSSAIYVSPLLMQASPSCEMVFYYHMTGTYIGQLEVTLKQDYLQSRVFFLLGDQQNVWKKAVVYIGRMSNPFNVVINARRTFSTNGDIAIDDIFFQNCGYPAPQSSCAANQFKCKTNVCISKSRLCDFTDDCGDNSDEAKSSDIVSCSTYQKCSFEQDFCFFQQDQTDDFDWSRRSGPTVTVGTGPSRDHTLNSANGHYLYIETSSPQRPGQTARLVSPFLFANDSSNFCIMRFYYEMFGPDINTLTVYYRTQVNGQLNRLWGRNGNVG
ncbi:hypothetical protein DPMN_011739 [Dreissena polymorpha]|uniref:MAM domain-containing protein n=2 Tax=Dreissena polymorpha TaxID=45954 RepID=A0A9D4N275_DREPO|nr:hypothetical protein DPMN_011739 [Dreissena polymorpha]